jgi:DNA-binding NtrC family response regulator
VGQSPQVCQVRRLIEKAARSRSPVLLLGESGTGKEVVARAIHQANPAGPFVPIDCGALVGPLLESELFGHVRGAFTGASEAKKGLIEMADGGTVFFDEIGDLPLEMQVKLLRLLQEHDFRPVGALQRRRVDIRVIAATHRDLEREVARGAFRQDLFYRLNVLRIHLPALRERKQDIPLLIGCFVEHSGRRYRISREALEVMLAYSWPGNVRELQNAIESMTALHSGPVLHVPDLPTHLRGGAEVEWPAHRAAGAEELPVVARAAQGPVRPLCETEKRAILEALEYTGGDRAKAAQLLRIGRTTLYRKLKEYQIER